MLSCTTTFELGVDVGDLQVVFMRNMPPTPEITYSAQAVQADEQTTRPYCEFFAQSELMILPISKTGRGWYRDRSALLPYTSTTSRLSRRHIHAEAIATISVQILKYLPTDLKACSIPLLPDR